MLLFLAGCEVTRDISIGADGSGTVVTVTDMSSMIALAKMSGKANDLDKLGDKALDTTISLSLFADSIPDLTADEKAFIRNGTLGLTIDPKSEKFVFRLQFPFTDPSQISHFDKLSSRVMQEAMKEKVGEAAGEAEGGGMPDASTDNYYKITYAKGLIEKKLDKDKYAHVADDEEMQALKQMAGMGMGNSTIIIHLPAPVKKAEGQNVSVSDDKRTVTIKSNAEDFFEDGASQEFRIEY